MQPVVFSLLVLLSVMLYFTVSLMDPGFVLSDSVKVSLNPHQPCPKTPFDKMYSILILHYFCL